MDDIIVKILWNNDIYIHIINFINFAIPIISIYFNVIILVLDINKPEKIFQSFQILLAIIYIALMFRFVILETVTWELDFMLWSIYEFFIFFGFIIRNKWIINVKKKYQHQIKD